MTDAALEIVFDHLYARRMRDLDALERGLHPDVVHYGVLPGLECLGRAAVVERMGAALAHDGLGVDRIELSMAGDRVIVALAGQRFRDVPFLDGELFVVFTVRDALIVRLDDFRTREAAWEAAETRVP
jgi:hypothetical protein